ncbi:MAG: hypothetical protein KAS23_16790 [Anaerohalosphaera sp.]|nr:hypothetical protein [Anaerohalosphaera sp.]
MQKKDKINKLASTLIATVEAQRKAAEQFKHQFTRPSQRIVNDLWEQQKSIERIHRMFKPSQFITEMIERDKKATTLLRKLVTPSKYLTDIQKSLKKWDMMAADLTKTFEHFTILDRTAESLRKLFEPSLNTQKDIARFSKLFNSENTLKSLTDRLGDFAPTVTTVKDSLVIDTELFSQEQICQIANDYLLDANSDKNVFRNNNKKIFWTSIPKCVLWVILILIALYVQAGWRGLVKGGPLDLDHFEKLVTSGRKHIVKYYTKWFTVQPFVNTKQLKVYLNPKRKSRKIADLKFLQEVKVLKFTKKKRWALIEWEDESNETHQGWTLARYIYRKNNRKD